MKEIENESFGIVYFDNRIVVFVALKGGEGLFAIVRERVGAGGERWNEGGRTVEEVVELWVNSWCVKLLSSPI